MNRAENSLFRQNQKESTSRIPSRPLGSISNFVVEQMPVVLGDIRAGRTNGDILVGKSKLLLDSLPPHTFDIAISDPSKRDLAGLDLKMLEAGIIHSGLKPPEHLVQLVDRFANEGGQPSIVTYEDLIFINPLDTDPRTYTDGVVGKSERDFYIVHKRIEDVMEIVNGGLKETVIQLAQEGESGIPSAQVSLAEISAAFQSTLPAMDDVGDQMPKEHFKEFRGYFTPVRGLKGASGAFSTSIPTFDLLLGGENLDPEHLKYMYENQQYFPRQGYEDMQAAIHMTERGLTLNALQEQLGNNELTNSLIGIDNTLKRFRGKHIKAIARQLPDVLRGESIGSAGETDVAVFLKDRINTQHITRE